MYYKLNKYFQISGLSQIYKRLLIEGLVHVGFSAGGMIMSEDLGYYDEVAELPENFQFKSGLGLFGHYIIPHYQDKPKYTEIYKKSVKKYGENVLFIPLKNSQAICINNNDWEILE